MVLGTPAVGTDDIVVEVVVVLPFKPERDFLILGLVLRPTPTMLDCPNRLWYSKGVPMDLTMLLTDLSA
jgi:hypothetical protein